MLARPSMPARRFMCLPPTGGSRKGYLAAGEREHGPKGSGRVPVGALQANRGRLSRATAGTWDARVGLSF